MWQWGFLIDVGKIYICRWVWPVTPFGCSWAAVDLDEDSMDGIGLDEDSMDGIEFGEVMRDAAGDEFTDGDVNDGVRSPYFGGASSRPLTMEVESIRSVDILEAGGGLSLGMGSLRTEYHEVDF